MRKILIVLILSWLLVSTASALDIQSPEVPLSAQACMPSQQDNLIGGLREILTNALQALMPDLLSAGKTGLCVLAVTILCSLVRPLETGTGITPARLLGVSAISLFLLESTQTFLRMGMDVAQEIGEYGGLLLPAMSTAMVASGGTTKASALYLGTAFFSNILTQILSHLMEPLLFAFIASSIACAATGNDLLKRLGAFFKGCMTWCLKLVLYLFTGYMTITGVISGSVDATALRAAKITISGVVPVVGGIVSDASEAILVGAGAIRGTLGLGGVFVVLSIVAVPFLKVASQHLTLKVTGAFCGVIGEKCHADLVDTYSQAMGLILAMVGTVCLLQLISTICFLQGVGS